MPLARLFFRNRHLTLLTVAVLIAAGLSALSNLPRLEDPRITTRNAIVITPYPGATAMRVEALVSKPLEDRLREIHEVKEIESTSRAGVSLITVELEDAIGPDRNEAVFSEIRDKLADAARKLPPEAGEPEFDDQRGAVAFSMVTAVGWGTVEPARLGILQRHAEELADRLRNIPATEIVRLYGKPEEEITVTVDAAELAALGLTAEEVAARVAAADPKAPAGTLRTPIRSTQLEVAGELDSLQRIGEIPLRENGSGAIVTLDDVGELNRSWRDPPLEIAYADGGRAVFVAARVVADARVDDWAQRARSIVEAFALEVGGGIEVEVLFDQSRYTESRLANLGGNLSAGAAVVMLVVFFAMGWRAALIVGLALPLSAGAALFGLGFFGEPIHQMTVFGLIVAIGLLIDNAIVVTEDVRQRLALGRSREQAVAAATRHLFAPLLASTLTTVLGFMPVFLLPGNVGDFVGPIAISVILALLASFLVSVTVIAVLAARYQSRRDDGEPAGWWREGLEPGRLGRLYAEFIRRSVRRPLPTLGVVLLLPTIGFALASTLDNQFFPPAERDQFEIEVRLRKGASIHRVAALSREIDALIRQEAAVARVDWLIGGSFPSVYYNLIMNQDGDPAYAHAIVTATDAAATYGLIPALQTALDEAFPQAQTVVSAFGQGPPYEAPVAFRLVGPETDRLRGYGEELRRTMHSVPGVLHTRTTVGAGQPKLWFNAVESEVRALGLTLSDLAGQLQASSEGHVGGFVLEDITQMPVRIRLGNADRGSLEHFGSFRFMPRAKEGQGLDWVPAETLGRFEMRPEAGVITRRDGERVNKVLGYTDPGVLPIEVTRAVLQRLNEQGFELAPGYRLEIAGDSEEQGRAVGQLATYLPVLALLMVATLVLTFSSFALGALIALVAVLSVGLGMLALWLSGHPLGFNPLIGSAGLVGVAINGSIVVLAAIRANPLARAGEADAVAEVTVGATRHIVATTLTTTGGFLPLILGGGAFWPPLAVVIAGGVALSTVLALLLTPAAYRLLARAQMRRELPRGGQSIAGNGSDKRGCVPPVPIDRAA